jgi:hypothetical protein
VPLHHAARARVKKFKFRSRKKNHETYYFKVSRVTRLGEFSPIGRLFIYTLWVVFKKKTNSSKILGRLFQGKKLCRYVLILTKIQVGPHFGQFFAQTHLVTLIVSRNGHLSKSSVYANRWRRKWDELATLAEPIRGPPLKDPDFWNFTIFVILQFGQWIVTNYNCHF